MAIPDGYPAGQVAPGRGGFYRSSQDVPYVSDPSGEVVKSGERKGQPKRLAYGSPSGFGKQIESTYNLSKWSERRVVMGIGVDLALIADCAVVARMDPESEEYRSAADRIVVRAKEAAQVSLAADRGTHGHALTEDHDEERDWIVRAEAGEVLGLDANVQAQLVQAWNDMLQRDGLEILAVEAACVNDEFRTAGTLDRIARLTKDLRFSLITGEVVIVKAGTVVVLDVKTGKRRQQSSGVVIYWQSYAVQIANYAGSVPYDTQAETRGEWPWGISQTHALIAHLDVLGALEGNPTCELVYVDIEAGRDAARLVVEAKAWEKRSDVFSIAQLDDAIGIGQQDAPSNEVPIASNDVEQPSVIGRAEGTIAADPPTAVTEGVPAAPVGAPSKLRTAQLEREAAFAEADAKRATPELPSAPDEGDDLSGDEYASGWAAMIEQFKRLDRPGLDWRSRLVREATRVGVDFQVQTKRTARRFEINRGLIALAAGSLDTESDRDEVLRALVSAALDSDAALFPSVTPGHALGSLDAHQAARFAELATGQPVFALNDAAQLVVQRDLATSVA